MIRLMLLVAIAVVLTAQSAFPQSLPCDGCPIIRCGETKHFEAGGLGSHSMQLALKYSLSAGDIVTFEARSPGYLEYLIMPGQFATAQDGDAWICAWEAPETGDYLVLLDGGGVGWEVSLTMHCGTAPENCTTAVAPSTWSWVKVLFR